MIYIVTTPRNPEYSEKTFGIQFNKGRAVVDTETLDPRLGYTVDEVIHGFKNDFGYEVREIGRQSQQALLEQVDPQLLVEMALKTGLVQPANKPRNKKKEAKDESVLPS